MKKYSRVELFETLVRYALAIPVFYLGYHNLTHEGWLWAQSATGITFKFKFLLGIGEILAGVALILNRYARVAAAALIPIFLTWILNRWNLGFAFRHGGWETPLVYLILAVALAIKPGVKG